MIAFIDEYRDCFSAERICRVMREHTIGGADCFLDSFRLPAGSGVCIVLWLIRRG